MPNVEHGEELNGPGPGVVHRVIESLNIDIQVEIVERFTNLFVKIIKIKLEEFDFF